MPKLIVQDGEKKRAFRLSKGRLTLGSAASNKLVLESNGVAAEHAVLVLRDDAITLDALAPVEIDGRSASGPGLAVAVGATVRVGGAVLVLAADAAEAAPAPAAAAMPAAKPGAKPAAKAAAAPAASGATRGASRSGGRREKEEASERPARAGRRGPAKGERPAWVMPTIVGSALVLVIFFITLMKGGNEGGLLNQGLVSLTNGDLQHARKMLDSVDRAELGPKLIDTYDDLKAKVEAAENEAKVGPQRTKALRWADQYLSGYITNYLAPEKTADDTPELVSAKKRLWLTRFQDFERRYPDWASAEWQRSDAWKTKVAELTARRDELMAGADPSKPPTDADIEWVLFYYTTAKSARRYDLARIELDRYAAGGGSAAMAATHREALDESALNYANAQIDLARKFYENAVKEGGEINEDYKKSAAILIDVAMTVGLPEKGGQALTMLSGFKNLDQIVLSYVFGAQTDDAAADKVAFLEGAGPDFVRSIAAARAEIERRAAAAAALKQPKS
jgi:hypothetical protein